MAFNLTAQLNVALNTASLKNAANTINSQLKDVGAVSLGIPKNDGDSLRYIKVQAAEASTAMEQFGRQSGLAAKRFVAFTLTAGAIITFTSSLKQALTAAVDFDREMIRLTQVSTDSVGQVGAVGAEVSRLSKNYGVSSKELLTTAVTLKQANLSLADTKVALEALAQAALAPSFDNLRDTTEGAIAVMNQFGISAKDLGNALGAINAVAAEFAVEAQDLIEGVRKAGGAFKSAGGDLNEFLALFTSIRQTTRESAESIGTGLRTIFTRVQRNETVEALKEIGVQLRYTADEAKAAGDLGLANQFVGPYEAVKRLSGALNELRSTDPRFSAIIEELGGYRQISKVIPLIQEFGVAQKALGVAQIGGASLALNAAQAQEAFGVKIQKVKEEFADFIRNLTNTSSFRSLIDLLLGAASAGIALADSLKGVLPVITAIAAVKTVQSLTGFAKGFGSTAFSPAPANQPSTFSPFLPTGTRRASGGIIKMAKGGVVPGVGRGDKVPALLEPGELVIPRNRFEYGGLASNLKSQTIKQLVQYVDVDEGKYSAGQRINPTDNIVYNIKYSGVSDPSSIDPKIPFPEQGKIFEQHVAQRFGGKLAKGNFAVDMFAGNYPYEIKNTKEFVPETELEDKLVRFRVAQGIKQFSNSFYKNETINLGELGVVYNTAKISDLDKLNDKGVTVLDKNKDIKSLVKTDAATAKLDPSVKPFVAPKGKALGGLVPGVGNTDSVPLDLPIGSYVVKKSSVNSIGASNLSRLGRASGGVIPSLVMPGEYIYSPDETKQIGVSNLNHMNTTGRKKFASGGYGTLTPAEIKNAQRVEQQLKIPTNKAEKRQNRQEAIAVAEDITNTSKQVKALEPLYKQQANKVAQGQKNEENINARRADILKTMEERKGILKDVKAKEQEERDIQARHISNAKAKEQEIRGLETQKRGVAVGSREEKAIDKKIQSATRVKTNYENLAANKQASIDAAASTTAEAQKNVGQSVDNLKQVNKSAARNKAFVDQAQKDLEKTGSQVNALKNKYSSDQNGNFTKEGKVITSNYGETYNKTLKKELSNYKKLYGEEATGSTREAITTNLKDRAKAGYFNQLKSFSEAKGLTFNETLANKQADQMAKEVEAGRRKVQTTSTGEFYDKNLAKQLKSEGYSATGEKGRLRKITDFGKGLVSKEGLQNSAFAVSSGIGLLGSAIGPQQDDYKKAIAGGTQGEEVAKAGAKISGGLTGAATGLAIGSFAGPFGMAAGALIGGIVGVASGLADAEKQISNIKLEESGNKLKNAFEVAATSFGKISQTNLTEITMLQSKIDEEISKKANASTSYFTKFNPFGAKSLAEQSAETGSVERKSQYAGQASGINSLLSKQIQEDIKSSPIVKDEKGKPKPYNIEGFFNDNANADQITRLAIGLGQPIDKIKKQLSTFAKDFERQQNAVKNQTQAIEAAQKLSTAFSLISDASTNAANSLNNLTPAFQNITDSLSSNFSVSQKQKISSEIQLPSIDPKAFLSNLTNVTGGLGSSGQNLQSSGTVLAEMSSLLPSILANIRPNDMGSGKDPQSALRSALTSQLRDKGLNENQIQSYVNSVVGKMGEDFTKMLSESGGDYNELAKKLMSNVSDPFLNAFKAVTANLEKAADAYVGGINKLVQSTLTTVQEFDKLSKIQQQTRNIRKNTAIEDEVKRQKKARPFSDVNENVIGLDMTSVADQTQAFREQQNRLTGVDAKGKQLTPDEIQARIVENRSKIEQAQTKQNNSKLTEENGKGRGDYVDATNELGRLKVEASLLNQAMKNLADSTEEISVIEQRVGKIRQEIAKEEQANAKKQGETEDQGQKLLTSSPEQLQRLQAGAQLTNAAKSIGGNLLRFNIEQRKAIFEYLDFSGDEGKKLKSQLLQASGFVSKPETGMQDRFGPQLTQLNAQLLAVMAIREQAQINIIKDQQTLQGAFFTQLSAQNEVFFTRLGQQLLMPQVAQQQQIGLESNAKLTDMRASANSVGLFNPLDQFAAQNGKKNGQDYYSDVVRPKTKEITSFLDAEQKRRQIVASQNAFVGQETSIAGQSIKVGQFDINGLITALGRNQVVQNSGLDIAKISTEIEKRNNGQADPKVLGEIIASVIRKNLTLAQTEQEAIQGNLAGKLGLSINDKGGISQNQQNSEKGLGGFVMQLIGQNTTGAVFAQATEDVKRLGGVIGTQFTAQIAILEGQAAAATAQVAALNAQIAALGQPKPQVQNPQNVNAIAPPQAANPPVAQPIPQIAPIPQMPGNPFFRPVAPQGKSTGGMVTHSSAMVGADPKVFKPIGPDTIPAMLNHGEYVVNAKATSENLPLLQALNGGGTVKPTKAMNAGGAVNYLQVGGGPIDAPFPVNRVEAKRILDSEKQRRIDLAVLEKFGNLRGSWRRNALNNSLRIQAGDSNITNIPYKNGQLAVSAIVSPAFSEPWTPIKDITTAGLQTNNLNRSQKEALSRKLIFGMPLNIKPVNYQWITGVADKYIRGDLTQGQKNTNANANRNVFDITAKDEQGNTREYYRRRANLDPFFQELLIYGGPDREVGEGNRFVDKYGFNLQDENFPVLGFSKGGQAGGRTPAMVQSGEFIVGADKAKKNKGLLDHMNGGGKVSYLSFGGMMKKDEFMRNSWNPGENALYDSLKGVGRLKIKRTDPIRLGAVGEVGPQIPRETASYRDYTRHYLGERKAAQISRVLDRSPELDDNAPTTRLRKTSTQLDAMLRSGELDTLSELSAGIYRKKYDVATTYPQGNSMLEIDTLRHEFGGHGAQYAAEIEGSRLNNAASGSFDMEGLANDKKPTRFLAELHARMVQLKDPLARFEMFKYFSTSNGAAAAYGSSPWLGKDGRGWHEDALKYANENDGLVRIDDLLKGRGKGKEVMLIEEIMRRAGKDTSVTTQIDGKTYLDAKKAFDFKPMPTVKLSAADEIVRNTFAGTESSIDRSVQPKKTVGALNPKVVTPPVTKPIGPSFVGAGKKAIVAGAVGAISLFGAEKAYGQGPFTIDAPVVNANPAADEGDNLEKIAALSKKRWDAALMVGGVGAVGAVGAFVGYKIKQASTKSTNASIANLFPGDALEEKRSQYRNGDVKTRLEMIKKLKKVSPERVKENARFIRNTTSSNPLARNIPGVGFLQYLPSDAVKGIGNIGKGIGNIVSNFNSGELGASIIKALTVGKSDEIPMNKAGGVDWGKNIPTNQIEASIKSPDTTPQMRAVLQKILDERAGKPTSEVSTKPVGSTEPTKPTKPLSSATEAAELAQYERDAANFKPGDVEKAKAQKAIDNAKKASQLKEEAAAKALEEIRNDAKKRGSSTASIDVDIDKPKLKGKPTFQTETILKKNKTIIEKPRNFIRNFGDIGSLTPDEIRTRNQRGFIYGIGQAIANQRNANVVNAQANMAAIFAANQQVAAAQGNAGRAGAPAGGRPVVPIVRPVVPPVVAPVVAPVVPPVVPPVVQQVVPEIVPELKPIVVENKPPIVQELKPPVETKPTVKPKPYRDPSTTEGGNTKPGPKPLKVDRFGHPTGDTSKPTKPVVPPSTKPTVTPPAEIFGPPKPAEIFGPLPPVVTPEVVPQVNPTEPVVTPEVKPQVTPEVTPNKPVVPPSTKPPVSPLDTELNLKDPTIINEPRKPSLFKPQPDSINAPGVNLDGDIRRQAALKYIQERVNLLRENAFAGAGEINQASANWTGWSRDEIKAMNQDAQNIINIKDNKKTAAERLFRMKSIANAKVVGGINLATGVIGPHVLDIVANYLRNPVELRKAEALKEAGKATLTTGATFAVLGTLASYVPAVAHFLPVLEPLMAPVLLDSVSNLSNSIAGIAGDDQIANTIKVWQKGFPDIASIYPAKGKERSLLESITPEGNEGANVNAEGLTLAGGALLGTGLIAGGVALAPLVVAAGVGSLVVGAYKVALDAQAVGERKKRLGENLSVRRTLDKRFQRRGFNSIDADFMLNPEKKEYVDLQNNDPSTFATRFSDELEASVIPLETLTMNDRAKKGNWRDVAGSMITFPYFSANDAKTYEALEEYEKTISQTQGGRDRNILNQDRLGLSSEFASEITDLEKGQANEQTLTGVRAKYLAKITKDDPLKRDPKTNQLTDTDIQEVMDENKKAAIFSRVAFKDEKNYPMIRSRLYELQKNNDPLYEQILNSLNADKIDLYKRIGKEKYVPEFSELIDGNKYPLDDTVIPDYQPNWELLQNNDPVEFARSKILAYDIAKGVLGNKLSEINKASSFPVLNDDKTTYDNLSKKYLNDKSFIRKWRTKRDNYPEQWRIAEQKENDLPILSQAITDVYPKYDFAKAFLYGNKDIFPKGYIDQYGEQEAKEKAFYVDKSGVANNEDLSKIPKEDLQKAAFKLFLGKRIQDADFKWGKILPTPVDANYNKIGERQREVYPTQNPWFKYDPRKESNKTDDMVADRFLQPARELEFPVARQTQPNPPKYMASGGIVPSSAPNPDPSFFKAKGSDTVPAILSPGEYVVNARATSANLPLLQNLNSGGAVKYLYRGGNLTAINPFYAAYSGQSPGRGYISSKTRYNNPMDERADQGTGLYDPVSGGRYRPTRYQRKRTDFDIGTQGYLASRVYNPRVTANTLGNLANYRADRSGILNRPDLFKYYKFNYGTEILKKHSDEFGFSGQGEKDKKQAKNRFGSINFSGGPIPNYVGGLNTLSNSPYGSAKMAGASKFAMEDAVFNDILNNKEISRAPITGYRTSAVGSSYISGLIGGPPNHGENGQNYDKVSLNDYINELGFSEAGNQSFQGVSANKALASSSLADVPGSNVGIAQQAISRLQKDGLGSLSVNNTDVAASTALDVIKNARISQANEPYQQISSPRPAPNPYYNLANNRVQGNRVFSSGPSYFKGFANGGSSTDTQPAMLTPGEFVVSKQAVNRVGTSFLDKVNNYAKGGPVGYFSGGTGEGRGAISSFDSSELKNAGNNLRVAGESVAVGAGTLNQTLQVVSGSFNSASSTFNQAISIMNTAASAMNSASRNFQVAVNDLTSALDRIPKTITLAIAPLSLNVSFNTPSILLAIQQSLSGITLNVAGMIASAIRQNKNDNFA